MHCTFWLWYQFYIICFIYYIALIFLERWVVFQKLIQPYTTMSSFINIWNVWISTNNFLWICWQLCVILSVVYLLFKAPFMLLIRSTNSFCSYHWILMSVYTDQWWAVIWLFYANLSCISIKRCMCIFIGQNSYDNSFLFLFIFCFIIVTQTWWYWNQSRIQKKIIKMFFMLSLECK